MNDDTTHSKYGGQALGGTFFLGLVLILVVMIPLWYFETLTIVYIAILSVVLLVVTVLASVLARHSAMNYMKKISKRCKTTVTDGMHHACVTNALAHDYYMRNSN